MNASRDYRTANIGYDGEGFACDPGNSERVISYGNVIYASTDGGNSFTYSGSGFSGANVTDILFDPDDGHNVFVAAIDYGLSRSVRLSDYPVEQRETQREKLPLFDYIKVPAYTVGDIDVIGTHGIIRDPEDGNHMFTSVGDWNTSRLAVTHDGGLTWTAVNTVVNTSSTGMTLRYHNSADSFIYAGKWYSADNGGSWSPIGGGRTVCAVSPVDNDVVFSKADKELYISRDRGAIWTKIEFTGCSAYLNGYFFNGIETITPDIEYVNTIWFGGWTSLPSK